MFNLINIQHQLYNKQEKIQVQVDQISKTRISVIKMKGLKNVRQREAFKIVFKMVMSNKRNGQSYDQLTIEQVEKAK